MRIRLLAAGTRVPRWVDNGFSDYSGRLPRECRLELQEISLSRHRRSGDLNRALRDEGERMLAALGASDLVVALDVAGTRFDTAALAERLNDWLHSGRDVALLVGGPDGLAKECLARADLRWSLSPLTFPHALVRVLIAEQLYRAWSILRGHPYHRE